MRREEEILTINDAWVVKIKVYSHVTFHYFLMDPSSMSIVMQEKT